MIADLPIYETVERGERGQSWNLDPQTYRYLASSALAIIDGVDYQMGIYRAKRRSSRIRYLFLYPDAQHCY